MSSPKSQPATAGQIDNSVGVSPGKLSLSGEWHKVIYRRITQRQPPECRPLRALEPLPREAVTSSPLRLVWMLLLVLVPLAAA